MTHAIRVSSDYKSQKWLYFNWTMHTGCIHEAASQDVLAIGPRHVRLFFPRTRQACLGSILSSVICLSAILSFPCAQSAYFARFGSDLVSMRNLGHG